MPVSPAVRGDAPASRLRIANAWRVAGASSASYLQVQAQGKAPPPVRVTGFPGTLSSLTGPSFQIKVSTPGPLGTMKFDVAGVLAGVTSAASDATLGRSFSANTAPGQATAINLGAGNSLTVFFAPGQYDTSDVYTVSFGQVAASDTAGETVAVGLQPIDALAVQSPVQVNDECLVRVHTLTAGALTTVTFPANPWDGMRVAIYDADGSCAQPNKGIAVAAGGAFFQSAFNANTLATSAGLGIPWQCVTWVWDAQVGLWRVLHDSHSGDLQPYTVASGTVSPVGRAFIKCGCSVPIAVHLPTTPTEGMRIRIKDVGGLAGTNPVTITTAQSSVGIDSFTGYVAGGTGIQLNTNFDCIDLAFDADGNGTYTAGLWIMTQQLSR